MHDPALGSFEVGRIRGSSRVTRSGLEVHPLRDADWDGIASIIRKALESRGQMIFRWPEGTPMTSMNDEAVTSKMNAERWSRQRQAAIYMAAAEALQQEGAWIAALPQDLLWRQYPIADDIRLDAEAIERGDWHQVSNFERYQDGSLARALVMSLRAPSSGRSIVSATHEILDHWQDSGTMDALRAAMPGLADRIDQRHSTTKGSE